MNKIKILQFPIANSKGGITKYVLQNWKFINRSHFHFDFATMSKNLDFAEELEKDGCKIYYISCYAEDDKEQFVKEFKKILLEEKYDIVHLHTKQWKSLLVEQLAKEAGVKRIIIHAHSAGIDTLIEEKREKEIILHNKVLKTITENVATDYWACSHMAADFIFGDKIAKQKIRIMNNAIDLGKYSFNYDIRQKYRKLLEIADDECVIGNIGRAVYQKNQDFLIKVFASLCSLKNKGKQRYKLLIIGTGECINQYKKMVHEYRISQFVIFLGYRNDISELLQVMDIFCLPSRFEGFPISLVEAQASGLLCLASEMITKEVNISESVCYCELEIESWVKAILELSRNYPKRLSICDKNMCNFDIKKQIKVLEEGYEGI